MMMGSEWGGSFKSFQAMRLLPDVIRSLKRVGCDTPTAVQQEAIVPLLHHRDIIVEAEVGSGVTTAYAAAVLQLCDRRSNFVQAVIATASYPYAEKIYNIMKRLAHYRSLNIHLCGSGPSIEIEKRDLAAAPVHIVIGSASKIHSMAHSSQIRLSTATIFIVDKTNEVFARNLQESLLSLSRYVSSRAQYGFFSETMPKQMDAFVAKLDLKCTRIAIRKQQTAPAKTARLEQQVSMSGIKHFYLLDDDYKIFCQLQELVNMSPTIICCGSRGRVESTADSLKSRIRQMGLLHSASSETERGIVLQQFRTGIIKIIVISDEILSESDLVQAPLIINIGLSSLIEQYGQRVCRPDRNGRQTVVINIVKPDELGLLGKIEEQYGIVIEELPMTEEEVEVEEDDDEIQVQLPEFIEPPIATEPVQSIALDSDDDDAGGLFTM